MDEQFQQPPDDTPPENNSLSGLKRTRVGVILSWFFIMLAVMFSQMPFTSSQQEQQQSSNPVQDLSLRLNGKYIVGFDSLFGHKNAMRLLEQTLKNLEKEQNIRKRICFVPVIAEVSGRESALAELNRLRAVDFSGGIEDDLRAFQQLYEHDTAWLIEQERYAIERYGWFGRLALSQDKDASNPERKAVLKPAIRLLLTLVLLSMTIIAAFLVGLVLLAVAITLRAKGRLRGQLAIQEKPGFSLLESFAIYITGLLVLPALIVLPIPGLLRVCVSILSVFLVIFAFFWPRVRETNWKEYRTAVGWHRGKGFFREIGCGIAGYLAGLPLLVLALVIVLLLSRYTGVMPTHPLVDQVNRDTFFLMFILACVWAPITEETFFRGMFFGYIRRRLSWVSAGVISALLFALIHPQGLRGTPVIGIIGFTLSAIREWRGSLIASMSAHALNNGSALLILFMMLD